MSKQQKLLTKFKQCKGQFNWIDLVSVLQSLGFKLHEGNGSRVQFINDEIIIKLHKPHPQKEVKSYAVKQVKAILILEGMI